MVLLSVMLIHSAINLCYCTAEHSVHNAAYMYVHVLVQCTCRSSTPATVYTYTALPFAHIDNDAKDVDKILLSLEKL